MAHSSPRPAPAVPSMSGSQWLMPAAFRHRHCSFVSSAEWPLFKCSSTSLRPHSTPRYGSSTPASCGRMRSSSLLRATLSVRAYMVYVRAYGRRGLMRSMRLRSLCAESAKGSAPTKCARSIATKYEPHACDARDCEEGLDHRLPISSTMNGQGITLQDRCTWLDSDGFLGQ